jgi:hypothetical protein
VDDNPLDIGPAVDEFDNGGRMLARKQLTERK